MVYRWIPGAVVAALFAAMPAQAITLSVITALPAVQSGDTVAVQIVAADFDVGEFVSAYDLELAFDPALLQYKKNSWIVGPGLGATPDVDFLDLSDFSGASLGSLLPFVVSLLDDAALAGLQPGPAVVLGSLELVARSVKLPTVAGIGLQCNSVAGPTDSSGNAVLLDVSSCTGAQLGIDPTGTVSEPGTLAGFAIGLFSIAGALRRRRDVFRQNG
jgi:hypothetical protein